MVVCLLSTFLLMYGFHEVFDVGLWDVDAG